MASLPPPSETQFKPGESGNPEGRPRGAKNRSTIAKQILNMASVIPDATLEKLKARLPSIEQHMTVEEIATVVLAHKALKGNPQAYKLLLDSAYGAPKQEMDLVGEIKITDYKLTVEVVYPTGDDN